MKERRLYKRHKATLPAKLETELASGEQEVIYFLTRNISIGGAFIYTKDLSFFQKGKPVIIDFKIPSGSFFTYLTEVMSCIDCGARMVRSTPEGIALQFN
ncbi:MAG: PilZ domain-containing protein [Desulfobacterales bacterium]|nr:MAG: PilZ domain-containing protein [Desulfobacterales bacterium]UCD88433.1 MAG: PilZ domain-containing protein [Desulfobacterales bacterium]